MICGSMLRVNPALRAVAQGWLKARSIGLFQRSALMRHWRESQGIAFEMLLSKRGRRARLWGPQGALT